MSTQDKKIKVVSTADFDNNKIINATIDASENEVIGVGKIDDVLVNGESVVENKIANVEVPTKVSDLENDSGYTTTADVNSEIIANDKSIDNILVQNSYNAVTNDAIVKGIEQGKVSVVSKILQSTESLPEPTEYNQSVLKIIYNNKVLYTAKYLQEISSGYTQNGSLTVDSEGKVSGFTDSNTITRYFQKWGGIRGFKFTLTLLEQNGQFSTPIFLITRHDDDSVLFGIDYDKSSNYPFYDRLHFYTKKRDGSIEEEAYCSVSPRIYQNIGGWSNTIFTIEMSSSNYLKVTANGKTIFIRYFESFNSSDNSESDFYYDMDIDTKFKSMIALPSVYPPGRFGIYQLFGLDSYISYSYMSSQGSYKVVDTDTETLMWDSGVSIQKNKLIFNLEDNTLYEYDGTNGYKLNKLLYNADLSVYQPKLTAGDNIVISPKGYINFNSTNYIQIVNDAQYAYHSNITIKFTLTELNRNNTLLYDRSNSSESDYCLLEINSDNKLSCTYKRSGGVVTTVGTHVFEVGKTYWIRTNGNYPQSVYYLEDNNYTLDTLPTSTNDWNFDIENIYSELMVYIRANSTCYLGYDPVNTDNYLIGSIEEFYSPDYITLSTAVEGTDFTNHGCIKGPVISAVVPEIDSQLSDISENPVQNRVIDSALKAMKPITVTDSGNALPSTSGYVLHDTFLNTTDKKIYGTLANAYELNDGSQITTNNATPVAIDYVTGIANNFSFNFSVNQFSYSYLARIGVSSDSFRWVGDRDYRVHFKITSQGTTNAKYMLFGIGHSVGYGSSYIVGVLIQDSKLYINELSSGIGGVSLTVNPVELINYTLEINKEYYLRLLKKSNGEVETVIYEDGYDQTILARNTVSPQINDITTSYGDNPVSLYFGGYWRGTDNNWGYGFNGDIYLLDSMGEFLKPASQLIWDNGTPIINLASYLDKTNSLLYYYESPDLISVGGGISDYSDLTNKPSINNVTLSGNKTSNDLGLQDTLVSGTNIKTVNGNSLLGSGNVTVKTYLPFNSSWTVNSTTEQLCDDINDDTNAVPGNAYLGILRTSDLPNNMIQADAVVEIIGESGGSKVIHITITSADQYPYRWEYSYFNEHSINGWIGFQPELPSQSGNSGKFLTTNGTNLSWAEVQSGSSYIAGGGLYIDNNNEIGMNRNTAFYNNLYLNSKDDNILESDIQFDMNTFYTYTGGADNNFYNFIYMNGAWNLRVMDYSTDPWDWDYIGEVDLADYGITYSGTPFENGWFILAGNYLTGKTSFTVIMLSFSNVFLNGILLTEGLDFTRNDNTITFINYTLKATDRIQVI